MAKININGTAHNPNVLQPDVNKKETVTWEVDFTPASNQYLRVQLDSDYFKFSKLGNTGGKGEKTVDLAMKFTDGPDPNVHIPYSLYLVTETGVHKSLSETALVTGSTTGPCLVIDDIGKPPNPFCPDDPDEDEEEKCAVHSGAHHERD